MTETTKTPLNINNLVKMVLGDEGDSAVIKAKVKKNFLDLSTADMRLGMGMPLTQPPVYIQDGKEKTLEEGNWVLTFKDGNVEVAEAPKAEKPKLDKTSFGLLAGCSSNPRFTKEF